VVQSFSPEEHRVSLASREPYASVDVQIPWVKIASAVPGVRLLLRNGVEAVSRDIEGLKS
jgi:hypothetical protein